MSYLVPPPRQSVLPPVEGRTLTFDVIGVPAPKGSVTKYPKGGYVQGSSASGQAAIRAWASAVSEQAWVAVRNVDGMPITGPVSVDMVFRFLLVASDKYRHRHVTTPDLDKIVRCTLDALVVGGMLADDSQVWRLTACKSHEVGWSGASIEVTSDAEAEKVDREWAKQHAAQARRVKR